MDSRLTILFLMVVVGTALAQDQNSNVPQNVVDLRALGKHVVPPRVIKQTAPDYPEELRKKRISGRVALDLVVDENGKPQKISVKNSSNHVFDNLAIDAVRQWRFEPAKLDGKPVAVRVSTDVNFRLY